MSVFWPFTSGIVGKAAVDGDGLSRPEMTQTGRRQLLSQRLQLASRLL